MGNTRDLDVVLFGATGFTGRLTARHLARQHGGEEISWAIAGRNPDKLDRIHRELVAIDPSCERVDKIVADLADDASLRAMAEPARVVATTAGPFVRYGEPVLAACVAGSADYVDITGEPDYVDMTLDRYDERAKKAGIRVVSCCGFDSIPHDMGVYYTVKQLPSDVPIEIEGFVRARGGMSGGTWTSAIEAFGDARKALSKQRRHGKRDKGVRRVGGTHGGIHYEKRLGRWVAPLPTIDPQVVKRSARMLDDYGPEFRYGHYTTFKNLPMLAGTAVGVGAVILLSQARPTRELLLRARTSGQGPSDAKIERGWFEVRFLADANGTHLETRVRGGDPGYGDTAKMLGESALCLALDRDALPDRAGVLTTATAMGDALISRLEAVGIRFETL
jgi:short subunit dehydrogenase-like uncharacterized protein